MDEKILTLHPNGKKGVRIIKRRYDLIMKAIITILEEEGVCIAQYLEDKINERLSLIFEGKIKWYVHTIKQDLEARKVIEIIPGSRPQMLRLKKRKAK